MLTRSDKTVANRYVYDDFGGFRSRTEAVTNPYAYTGREYDSAIDLFYYRARYYDPLIGRFLTRDPTGMVSGPNPYAYAGNNPIVRVDPSGQSHCGFWDVWCAITESACQIGCSVLLGLGVVAIGAAVGAVACRYLGVGTQPYFGCVFLYSFVLFPIFTSFAIGIVCSSLCRGDLFRDTLAAIVTWMFGIACLPLLWWDPLALFVCGFVMVAVGAIYAAMLTNYAR